MLRTVLSTCGSILGTMRSTYVQRAVPLVTRDLMNFSALETHKRLLAPPQPLELPTRSLTKFSLHKGKRKAVKAVVKKFYRLDWGVWIRGMCGRHKKLFKKSANRKRRLRQHVFCNASQSWLLDKMVTSYWRKPKYYVDDPYAPYHSREEFPFTRRKPYVPT